MRLHWVPLLATFGLVACDDPTFHVEVKFDRYTSADGGLTEEEHQALKDSIQVSVIDADSALEGPGIATCDDVKFGLISPDVLAGARRAVANASGGYRLSGVPRLGEKLVVAEARTRGGRLAAGCTQKGDVTDDKPVEVTLEAAPMVQVFARTGTTEPQTTELTLVTPWSPHVAIGQHPVRVEHHTAAGVETKAGLLSDDDGRVIAELPDEPPNRWAAGPAQTLIRVAWTEEPVRQPSFRAWPVIRFPPSMPNMIPEDTIPAGYNPRWAAPESGLDPAEYPFNRIGAVLLHPPDGIERIAVVTFDDRVNRDTPLRRDLYPTDDARDLAFFRGSVITVTPAGWIRIMPDGETIELADPGPAASMVHTVPHCRLMGDGDRRILVRRFEPALGRDVFKAYTAPNEPAGPTDDVAVLAGTLSAMIDPDLDPMLDRDAIVLGSACITFDEDKTSRPVRAVVVRVKVGTDFRDEAHIVEEREAMALPSFGTIATYRVVNNTQARAAAVSTTIYGPRVTAYKLARLAANNQLALVADGQVDAALALMPESFDVVDLGPGGRSIAAALSMPGGIRLQVSLDQMVDDQPLTAVTDLLRCNNVAEAARATRPIVRLLNVDRTGKPEIVVMSDAGIDVFCVSDQPDDSCVPAPAESRCAP